MKKIRNRIFQTITAIVFGMTPFVWAGDIESRDIIGASIEEMGGLEAFASLQSSIIERTLKTGSGSVWTRQDTRFPHSMLMEVMSEGEPFFVKYDAMEITSGNSHETLGATEQGTTDWFKGFYWREWWVLYARIAANSIDDVRISAEQPVDINGRKQHILLVEPRGASSYRLYIDAKTMRPSRRVFGTPGDEVVDVYSNFEAHDGIWFPMKITSMSGGKVTEEILYSRVDFEFQDPR